VTDKKSARWPNYLVVSLLGLLLTAFALRVISLSTRALWYDELQSVTHAFLPVPQLLQSVKQFDPHPPFYYLQLHFWMKLGLSDFWIKFNSVAWSMLALASLFALGRKLFNKRVALLAAACLAVSPLAIAYAQEARMYALLMCVSVWSLWFTHQLLYGRRVFVALAGLMISVLTFLYSHGAGFMLLVSLVSYVGMCQLGKKAAPWKRVLAWGGELVVILVLYYPWLIQAQSIRVGHTLAPDLNEVTTTFLILLFGFGEAYPAGLRWLGLVFVILAVLIAWRADEKSRRFAMAFGAAPIIFCLLVSYLFRPIWLYRTLAYLVPVWCLIVSVGTDNLLKGGWRAQTQLGWRVGFSMIPYLTFLSATIVQQLTYSSPWHIRSAAYYVEQAAQVGEIVYIPNERVFWGWAWYFVGRGSVNPLTATYQLTSSDGIRVVSNLSLEHLIPGQSYWLIYRQIDSIAPFQERSPGVIKDFDRMTVEHVVYQDSP
jgi:mannosyltransferase